MPTYEYECQKCGKTHERMPLQGTCDCGGVLLFSRHGSSSERAVQA